MDCPTEPKAPAVPVSPCEKDFGLEQHHGLSYCCYQSLCLHAKNQHHFWSTVATVPGACRRKGKRVSILGSETRMPVLVLILHGLAHGAVDSIIMFS